MERFSFASVMISVLVIDITTATLLAMLSFFLSVCAPSFARASDGSDPSPTTSAAVKLSADRFDWREMVPYLFAAATLPGEQGIKVVLESSKVLRAYVANEVRVECSADRNSCAANGDGSKLDEQVSKRIEEIVQEGIFRRHKTAIVDYLLARQPFPFSEIVAMRSEKQQDAYLVLALPDHSYTALQVQAKYGAPYDTDIFQWYSVYKYRLDSPRYTSKAVFEIDPTDGAVIKVAISLKARKPKNRH